MTGDTPRMNFETVDCLATPDGWRCRVAIPEGHPVFEGHFPGHPILPAIAHLAIAAHVLSEITRRAAQIAAVPLVRLRRPVVPGDVLDVTIGRPSPDGTVEFDIRRGEERVSNGIVVAGREE